MPSFVLDNSVTMRWCFKDGSPDDLAYANGVLEILPNYLIVVPNLWHLEVANVLVRAELKNWITAEQRTKFISLLDEVNLKVDDKTAIYAMSRILDIARQNGLSTYDAAYLELALRLHIPLATLDKKLRSAAENLKVDLIFP